MRRGDYDFPIFENEDVADLNEYSEELAGALKVQIDKFGNPLTFQGAVETLADLEDIEEPEAGYIYMVESEGKNYIYNGTDWVIYSEGYETYSRAELDIFLGTKGASISLSIDSSTYVMTLQLKNSSGTVLSTGTIDLPLETMVVGASYDSSTQEIVLTLKNGNTTRFSVADLVSGLVSTTTLNTNYYDKTNTNSLIKGSRYIVTTTSAIAENTDYTIPCSYIVGSNMLDIYYMGEKLIKGTHYIEVGTSGASSTTIQFYNWGQSVPSGRTLEFVVRGV